MHDHGIACNRSCVAYIFKTFLLFFLNIFTPFLFLLKVRQQKKSTVATVCSADECIKTVFSRGVCSKHYRKVCSIEGCATKAKARGLCGQHGARGKCIREGCVTNAQKKDGYCGKHSKKEPCRYPECTTPAVPGKGRCTRHGAEGICKQWGCKKGARKGRRGHCIEHGKGRTFCSAKGCSNNSLARNLCGMHGAFATFNGEVQEQGVVEVKL